MLYNYFLLKIKILKRSLFDELSLVGIIILFLFISILFYYVITYIKEIKYWEYISIAAYIIISVANAKNKKDIIFLRTQGINVFKIQLIENISLAILFGFLCCKYILIFILLACIVTLLLDKIHLKSIKHIIHTPFVKGSFEWISGYRIYLFVVVSFELVGLTVSVIYKNYTIAQMCAVVHSVALGYLFINLEPNIYIYQYNSFYSLFKSKVIQIVSNVLIFNLPIFIVHIVFFPKNMLTIFLYTLFQVLLMTGNLLLKYAYSESDFARQIRQAVLMIVFVMSCLYYPLVLLLLALSVFFSVKLVSKNLYDDKGK